MKKYEIMFIVRPTLSEDEIKKVAKEFENVLTTNGATVTDVKEMGQRELAYEIKDFKNGYYYVITLEASDDKAINEFKRVAKIEENVIRDLVLNLDK